MSRTILTAAHCVYKDKYACKDLKDLRLIIRAMDLSRADDDGMYDVKISKIEIHENYDRKTFLDYDFAIISLDCDLEYDPGVAPICLSQSSDPSLHENRDVVVIGWGRKKCKNNLPSMLQVIDINH